jgi:hypothetical protein
MIPIGTAKIAITIDLAVRSETTSTAGNSTALLMLAGGGGATAGCFGVRTLGAVDCGSSVRRDFPQEEQKTESSGRLTPQ